MFPPPFNSSRHDSSRGFRTVATLLCLAILLFFCLSPVALAAQEDAQSFSDEQLEFFEANVRPLLVEKCFDCHGPEAKPIEGGLSLSSRQDSLIGGDTGPAIVPGSPDESLLIDAINYGDVYEMPPDTKMSQDEIETLSKWIQMGAPWTAEQSVTTGKKTFNIADRKSAHWCWQPVKSTTVPKVQETAWPLNPIDNFILSSLESARIKPAENASKRTLIRRLYFDIIGLPPSPDQIQQFLDDDATNALEKVVNELLASPRFGERWARHWMDLTRYAETCGHEFDYPIPHAYRYRDYLIRAFNADVAYDQMIREHIAGDLLAEPRRHAAEKFNESLIGTGFWFFGEGHHAPVDVKADEAARIDNQIDVMSKTFLGLTVSCAKCHDHKFDAISTKDYYALAGFLKSSRRQDGMLDPGRRIESLSSEFNQLSSEADPSIEQFNLLATQADSQTIANYLAAAVVELRNDAEWNNPDPTVIQGEDPKVLGNKRETTIPQEGKRDSEKEPALLLDQTLVKKLVAAIKSPRLSNASHPLHLLQEMSKGNDSIDTKWAKRWKGRTEHLKQESLESARDSVVFDSFDCGLPASWYQTGFATTTSSDSETAHISVENEWLAEPAGVHSGRGGRNYKGVIRSPTFKISHDKIYYRIKGEQVQIRLIIEGYQLDIYNALLFKGMKIDFAGSEDYRWVEQSQDLKNHLGRSAHIEILDLGEGYFSVDQILFSNGPTPIDSPTEFIESLTQQFGETFQPSIKSVSQRVAEQLAAELPRSNRGAVSIKSWIIEHELATMLAPTLNKRVSNADDDRQFVATTDREITCESIAETLRIQRQKAIEINKRVPQPQFTPAITDGTGENEHIFIRGNHKTLGKIAERNFLEALTDRPMTIDSGSGRLQLANRIADADNPLTSRVVVNRVWHHLLGRGIVASVDNFGVLGQPPTHPELLDYLAIRFVEQEWSLKTLIRDIVLSRTYQLSSIPNPYSKEADADNTLFHSANIHRLEGEAIRDSILSVSGELDSTLYGPSIPIHLTPFMGGRGRPAKSGPLDGKGRRSIYVEVRRNFMSPMMLAFDTPSPFNAVGKRNRSNVPAQALILMNDPFVSEQAEQWAKRLIKRGDQPDERIRTMYLEAFGRPPTTLELSEAQAFLKTSASELGLRNHAMIASVELWRDLCHVLFNVKPFIFVE